MTSTPAPTVAPDLTLVRTHRDRTGAVRCYVDDDLGTNLIGSVTAIRTRGATGKKCTRWQPTPAAFAWTLGRIGVALPDGANVLPLPADHLSRDAAIRALVEHLRAADAPGVAGLYGPPA